MNIRISTWNLFKSLCRTLLPVIYFTILLSQKTIAQDGLINDAFSTGNSYNWGTSTTGATGQIVNGQFVITAALQSNGKYRGDFQKTGGVTLHAGNYPILAIKLNKPPRCNWFFDSNLGSYNNSNNNSTKIVTDNGNVYYWDLSTGKLGTTILSTTQPTTLSLFQFKIADIDFSSTELAAGDYSYEIDWVKTFSSVDALRAFVNPSGTTNPVFEFSGAFSHPGLLHNSTDLARIKDLVTRQVSRPYKSYQLLLQSSRASSTYTKAGPFKYLTRDASLTIQTPTGTASGGAVKNGVENDFLAAYYNALMWNITGNTAHAQKAIEILDAYSGYTVGIIGADAELNGLYGFMLANAAELIRYTYSGWPQDKIQQCQTMLQNVFYPTLQYFRPCAHGNWDIICMKALMAIAIFSNDNAMYNKVVNYFYYGEGNGSIKNYVLTDAGQLQESNRDQPHTMLAIGSLAEIAEMALKQSLDLYSANNNAIMRGYEYTAKYNLGYDVPYQTSYDFCEKNYQDYTPESISSNGRGQFRSIFEIGYNHYVFRKNKSMPNTLEALATVLNPEGAPFGADNPGYGSLFFYLNSDTDYVYNGSGNTAAGLVNDNFNGYADGWVTPTSGATATVGTQEITITMAKQTNGSYRGDFKRSAGAVVHAGNYPILAIKMKKPAVVNLTFDTNLGAYGNGANKWTGKVGADIYYYDLTKGFGSAPSFLSTTGQTTLTTFQFKVADVPAGAETSYTVDWVKTFKSVNDVLAYDPNTGLVNDNFTTGSDGWVTPTSGATAAPENGQLRITMAKQTNNAYRGDIKRTAGVTLYPGNYPIVAVKLKKPFIGNITFDTNLGSFGNGSNKQTGKVGESIFYFDLTKTGFGTGNVFLTGPTALTLWQFKVADVTSGETGYLVDWVKTVKTVEELQNLVIPMYQDITFPAISEKKVGDDDFSSATTTSGLPVSYISSNTSVATIVNGMIHMVGAGTTEISATQAGDNNYYPADAVKQVLTVYVPPTVHTRNTQVAVDEFGNASITPQQIDNGSTGYSGALTLSLDKTNFTCADIGLPITVTLTATDAAGHSGSSTAQVTVVDDKLPILTTPNNINVPADDGSCTASRVAFGTPVTSDNCGVRSVTNDAPLAFPVGTTTIIWTATDVHGNVSTATQTVTVTDGQHPVVTVPVGQFFCYGGNSYQVPAATSSDNCGLSSITYVVTGATDRSGSGNDASGTFNVGRSTITWTVTDIHGNSSTGNTDVTVYAPFTANIPDVYALNSEKDAKNTIYIGYGPSVLTLSATPTGSYTYQWYKDQQSISQTTQAISVSSAGTYSVAVTDQHGCTASASIIINTLNVECGNNNDKVMICHNGKEICVATSAVQDHLNHGDNLGTCSPTSASISPALHNENASDVVIFPNPVTDKLNISLHHLQEGTILQIYNVNGALVYFQRLTNLNQAISMQRFPAGIYYVKLNDGKHQVTEKIMKASIR